MITGRGLDAARTTPTTQLGRRTEHHVLCDPPPPVRPQWLPARFGARHSLAVPRLMLTGGNYCMYEHLRGEDVPPTPHHPSFRWCYRRPTPYPAADNATGWRHREKADVNSPLRLPSLLPLSTHAFSTRLALGWNVYTVLLKLAGHQAFQV